MKNNYLKLSYLPTPPLGQDMTQGQFLEEFNRFEFRGFLLLDYLLHQGWKTQSVLLFTNSWRDNNWIHTFPKGISAMWNAISLVQVWTRVATPISYDDNHYTTSIWNYNCLLMTYELFEIFVTKQRRANYLCYIGILDII